MLRKHGDARGSRELAAGQTAPGERNCCEPIAKLRRHPFGTCRIGVTENDKELLAAESYRCVTGANHAGEHSAHPAQDEVARTVPAGIVDLLKPVEVEHQDRKRLTTAKTLRHFALADLAKPSTVEETRQRVQDGALGQLRVELSIAPCGSRRVTE